MTTTGEHWRQRPSSCRFIVQPGRTGSPFRVRGGDRADQFMPWRSSARAPCSRRLLRRAGGRADPPPSNLDIATIQEQGVMAFRFHLPQYLTRRAADWGAGIWETLVDFPSLNARSKFWGDDQRGLQGWEEVSDPRNPRRAPESTSASCARTAAPGGHDGHSREPPGTPGPPAYPAPPGVGGAPAGEPPGAGTPLRAERGLTESDPAGYVTTVRSGLRAHCGWYALRAGLRHADHHSGTGLPFSGCSGRSRAEGCALEDRLGL
jgi:hypothetical protein